MTAASRPDPRDPEAVRRWMRANRREPTDRPIPRTPSELAESQHRRMLERLGPPLQSLEGDGQLLGTRRPIRRRMDIALTGSSTDQHTVRLDVLAPLLSHFQSSVTAIAQALDGRPTTHAPIPGAIREATALSAAATFPSSFGVVLYGPQNDGTDGGMNGGGTHISSMDSDSTDGSEPLLDRAVGAVLNLSDAPQSSVSEEELDQDLNEQLLPLGARALKHLGSLTQLLDEKNVGLRMTWHTESGRARLSELSPLHAERIRFVCEHSTYRQAEIVTIIGWLGGVSALHANAEIRTDSGQVIRAKTDRSVVRRLGDHFTHRVEARVEVTTVHYAGGRERKIYTILDLRNI
ncbi:hypothetical protein GCM10010329_27610 [Streptomyces spiroverticillatus]|uniref:Uncharacterized protein n=1 Tax=Streptomyces finlayi TaxID=67296 RepID=A0A919C9A4_9ACTN|nr:hypothetical protein [Streptomyces finlayi]GHA03685.1 hypothetical protein GCM10010329_27610 [Streptomyces spiroverticillatus]GHC87818.1 hypothetical protein GCM10010334_20020 [Streptomyces finlayi]